MKADRPHREGEAGGKFYFSESLSRRWVSFLLPCQAQVMFLIITDELFPVLPVVRGHKWMVWPPLLLGGAAGSRGSILEDKGVGGHGMAWLHEVECRFVPPPKQAVCGPLQKGMGRASRFLRQCLWLLWETVGSTAGKGSGL